MLEALPGVPANQDLRAVRGDEPVRRSLGGDRAGLTALEVLHVAADGMARLVAAREDSLAVGEEPAAS